MCNRKRIDEDIEAEDNVRLIEKYGLQDWFVDMAEENEKKKTKKNKRKETKQNGK